MEQDENSQSNSRLPVLPRLDRLDRLIQLMEEKHGLSGRHSSATSVVVGKNMEGEDQCKPLSSALEEVHHKGTLMERLSMLENRVLQLSLEMDEVNTSRSSSSTVPVSDNFGQGSGSPSAAKKEENATVNLQEKQDQLLLQEDAPAEATATEQQSSPSCRKPRKRGYKKWSGWCRMGCR